MLYWHLHIRWHGWYTVGKHTNLPITMPILAHRTVLALLMTTLLTSSAYAFDCRGGRGGWRVDTADAWTGHDKVQHFAVSAPFGALGAYIARDSEHPVVYGALLGSIPGLAKELYDGSCRSGGFSYKDLAADVAGALTGAALGNWRIGYQRTPVQQVSVSYKTAY